MSYSSEVLADSPLVYYRLNETSGTTMTDSSVNGRHATYFTAPTSSSGLIYGDSDKSVDFNKNNFGRIANESWMDTTAFTAECIFNADGTNTAYAVAMAHATANGTATATDRSWFLWLTPTGYLGYSLVFTDNTNLEVTDNNNKGSRVPITYGQTYHAALTWDGTNAKLYLNGVLQSSIGTSAGKTLRTNTAGLTVGADSSSSNYATTKFDGRIDEAAYYNTALSGDRIAVHAGLALGPVSPLTGLAVGAKGPTWLSATWDSSAGATMYDVSTNGGASYVTTSLTNYTLTGLTSGVAVTISVRPRSSYATGSWVAVGGVPTTSDHITELGNVITNSWVKNYTNSTNHQVWLTRGGNQNCTIVNKNAISLFTPGILTGDLTASMYMSTGADEIHLGVIDGSLSTNYMGTSGVRANASGAFYGFVLNTYSSTPGIWAVFGSTEKARVVTTAQGQNSHNLYTIRYQTVGTTLTMTLYRDGTQIAQDTGTAPAYGTIRAIAGGWTSGTSGNFAINGTPTWWDQKVINQTVKNLDVLPKNAGLYGVWDSIGLGVTYDWSIDGGTTFTNVSTNYVNVSGTANGTPVELQIRPVWDSVNGDWYSVGTKTPTALPGYRAQVLADDPWFYCGMDSTDGIVYKDNSRFRNHFTSGGAVIPDSTAITTGTASALKRNPASASTDSGIGTGVYPGYNSTTFSLEAWIRVPIGTFMGDIVKIGNANGVGLTVGGSNATNVGRDVIPILESVAWIDTNYPLPNDDNKVFHIVLTRNANAYLVYVNGQQVFSYTQASFSAPTETIQILNGANGRPLDPNILVDSVAFYPSTLSASRVQAHFYTGAILYAPVVESFPLNGGIVSRWSDIAGAESYEITPGGGTQAATKISVSPQFASIQPAQIVQLSSLSNGTSYPVQVRAKNTYQTNPGSWSAAANATPSATRYLTHLDNFNRIPSTTGPGSPQYGQAYAVQTGTWGITLDGQLYHTETADRLMTIPGMNNGEFNFEPSFDDVNLVFRLTDNNNYWQIQKRTGSPGVWHLYRYTSGYVQVVGSFYPSTDTDKVTVVLDGMNVFVWINGQTRLYFKDDVYLPSTTYRWGISFGGSNAARLDNVVAWSLTDKDLYGPLDGANAHIYKGHDSYNDDLGDIP